MSLSRCLDCNAFVPGTTCPQCRSARLRTTKLGALATLLGSSAIAMTLMACYGCPDVSCGSYYPPDADADVSDGDADAKPIDGGSDADADADGGRDADADAGLDAGGDGDADADAG